MRVILESGDTSDLSTDSRPGIVLVQPQLSSRGLVLTTRCACCVVKPQRLSRNVSQCAEVQGLTAPMPCVDAQTKSDKAMES